MKRLDLSTTTQRVCRVSLLGILFALTMAMAGWPAPAHGAFLDGFDTYTNGLLVGQGEWVVQAGAETNALEVADGGDPISAPKVLQISDFDSTSYGAGRDVDGRVSGNFSFHARHLDNNLANHSNPGITLYATLPNSAAPDAFFNVGFLNNGIGWTFGGVGNGIVSNLVSTFTWYRFEVDFELGPNGGTNLVDLTVTESISENLVLSTNLAFANNQGNRDRLGRLSIYSGSSHDPCQFEFDELNLDVIPTNCPPVAPATFEDFDGFTNGPLVGRDGWEQEPDAPSTNGVDIVDIPDPISCFKVVQVVDNDADGHGFAHNVDGGPTGFFQFYARHFGNNMADNSGFFARLYATFADSGAPDKFFQVGLSPSQAAISWTGFPPGAPVQGIVSNVVSDATWYRFDIDYTIGPGGDKEVGLVVVDVEADTPIVTTNLVYANNQGGRYQFGRLSFFTGSTHLPSTFELDHISLDLPLEPFPITGIFPVSNQVVITWQSQEGTAYTVQRNTDLLGGLFTNLQTGITGPAPTLIYTDTVTGAEAAYRVTGGQ